MKEMLLKGLSSGVVGAIATTVLFGDAGAINVFNMDINPALVVGASVAAGSIASDMLSENVIQKMNLPQNVVSTEELLIQFGLSGIAASVALSVAGVPTANLMKSFLLGGGSKLGGDYAYCMLLSPHHGMIPIF